MGLRPSRRVSAEHPPARELTDPLRYGPHTKGPCLGLQVQESLLLCTAEEEGTTAESSSSAKMLTRCPKPQWWSLCDELWEQASQDPESSERKSRNPSMREIWKHLELAFHRNRPGGESISEAFWGDFNPETDVLACH
ncbi:hypothetical protein P7K49_027238 [Saguinus oedipus]|uniref:Uncharacterized protein n=1 Tax=Saguinus oedipus TaxID=9490 RepID=A0ABQ9U8X5_SAGOE|nr:hypothetical protein P7K49_027238 [Saguinus oedipus]